MTLKDDFAKLYQTHVYKTHTVAGVIQDPDNPGIPHGIARKVDYFHNPEYPKVMGVDPTSSAIMYTYPTQPSQSVIDEQHPSYLVKSTVPYEQGLSFVDASLLKKTPSAYADLWEFLPDADGGLASSVLRVRSVIV